MQSAELVTLFTVFHSCKSVSTNAVNIRCKPAYLHRVPNYGLFCEVPASLSKYQGRFPYCVEGGPRSCLTFAG
jgi:hypothetical protein